jgi:hypothetical protein
MQPNDLQLATEIMMMPQHFKVAKAFELHYAQANVAHYIKL